MTSRRDLPLRSLASVLVGSLMTVTVVVGLAATPAAAATSTPVMGRSQVTAADLAGWFRSKGKVAKATVSIDELAAAFISEGRDEGVAGDIAFAQSIVETGYFTFSTRAPASFNNFSGLGAVDGGSSAASFATAQLGARAQMQHLRAYADPTVTTAKLAHPLVDPRFTLVSPKGKAPTWQQFGNGIWATDPGYAAKVLGIYQQILDFAGATPPPPPPPPPSTRFAPFASAGAAVDQAYADILGRRPTTGERSAAVASLEGGVFTPPQLLATLVAGEGADDAQPVARLYLAALGRLPDRSGLQYWTRRHAAGVPLVDLANQFIVSAEFNRRNGTPSATTYIDVLYRNVLGRPADQAGADYWSRRLSAGLITRSGLLVQFSESSENIAKTASTTEASVVYVGMVLRAPDPSVLSWWSTKRSGGSDLSVLTTLVYGSSAYQGRFS